MNVALLVVVAAVDLIKGVVVAVEAVVLEIIVLPDDVNGFIVVVVIFGILFDLIVVLLRDNVLGGDDFPEISVDNRGNTLEVVGNIDLIDSGILLISFQ